VQDNFDALVNRLIQNANTPKLDKYREQKRRIEKYYSPRERFNRWRDSEQGKAWKLQQYQTIGGVCLGCGRSFHINNFDIDHVEAIAKVPDLAIDLKNLQLLCSSCNRKKSSSFSDAA
jgi:5-methylcytosine-specific restriction endonuclease McrA